MSRRLGQLADVFQWYITVEQPDALGELGLAEVADPARAFLGDHAHDAPGSVVAPTLVSGVTPRAVARHVVNESGNAKFA